MNQAPRFGMHVIRGLTAKFNHHNVKVYHLNVFCLASLHIQTILNAEEESKIGIREPHTPEARARRDRERGFQTALEHHFEHNSSFAFTCT